MKISLALPLCLSAASGLASVATAQSPSTFTATADMTTPRARHTATLLADGTVLIAGGFALAEGFPVWSSAELYNPRTGSFQATDNMTTPRSGHTATLLPDGKVLIAGGVNSIAGGVITLVTVGAELYDPATKTFSRTGDMTMVRSGHAATLLPSGQVLIVGGYTEGRDTDPSRISAELYDPSTGTFSPTGNLAEPAAGVGATLLASGKVLITGSSYFSSWPIDEKYDPWTGTFSLTGKRLGNESTATLLMNGNVLVAFSISSFVALDHVIVRVLGNAELYDPGSETFIAMENVTTDYRLGHTATLLSDGNVLLAGGCGCETGANLFSADAYIYDPAEGTFGSTGSMHANRWGHTATLLNDGRVLIAGGSTFVGIITPDGAASGRTDTVSSAELYTPAVSVGPPVLLSLSGDGEGQGAILHAGTDQVVSANNPASTEEPLEIYLTGLTDGSVIPPQVAIGGRLAEVLWFGETPGSPNLNQVNVRVPSGVSSGLEVPVRLTYIGRASNEVTIGVK